MTEIENKTKKLIKVTFLFAIISGVSLISTIYFFNTLYESKQAETEAHEVRYKSYLLADQLRQSSDELTRMARTYVATGDILFKNQFYNVLDIRNGIKPRPLNYERPYWDLQHRDQIQDLDAVGDSKSLLSLMKESGFSSNELSLLKESLENSDELVALENQAFKTVEENNFSNESKAMAIQILYGDKYLNAKRNIMKPIYEFFTSIDKRTLADVENRKFSIKKNTLKLIISVVSVLASMIVCLGLLFSLNKNQQIWLQNSIDEKTRLLQLATDKAQKANEAKRMFLANMSHEIRTPMNAILGFTSLAIKKTNNKTVLDYLKIVNSTGESLLRILNDILFISKMESGKLTLSPHYFDLKNEMLDIYKIFELDAKKKNLEFHLEFPKNLPKLVELDKVRFRQILTNLVSNSVKFTYEGYIKIVVEVENIDDLHSKIVIDVIDSGPGIPKEMRSRIFENFEQLERDVGIHGTGLGLPISRQISSMMNGKLDLVDTPSGSQFSLTLEKVPFRDDLQNNIFEETSCYIFKQSKILVVDDNLNNLQLVNGYLEESGLLVTLCDNPKSAIELCRNFKPDIILMDLFMRGMDGETCSREISKIIGYKIPIIVASAYVKDSYSPIFSDSLKKPFSQKELYIVLSKFLEKIPVDNTENISEERKNPLIEFTKNQKLTSDICEKFSQDIAACLNYKTVKDFENLINKIAESFVESDEKHLKSWLKHAKEQLNSFELDQLANDLNIILETVSEQHT